jgi:hypothetical protein
MTRIDPQSTPDPTPDVRFDPWNFRPDVAVEVRGAKLADHQVEAADGRVGKVITASLAPGDSYLIITTGRLLGKETQLPAGIVNHVDRSERKIYVDRTKDQVKAAPAEYGDQAQRDALAAYYGDTYHATSTG